MTEEQKAMLDLLYSEYAPLGYDLMSISGIGGNGLTESGLKFDSTSVSKNYHGAWLNHTNIKKAIEDLYGDYSGRNLIRFIDDWNNKAGYIVKGKYAAYTSTNAGKYKKAGYKTAKDAADAFMRLYERPVIMEDGKVVGYQHADSRYANAEAAYRYLYNKYGKGEIKTTTTDKGKKITIPITAYQDPPQYESTYQLPKQTNTIYPLNPNDRTVPSLDAWNGADSPSAGPNMPSLQKSMDERKRMFDLFSDNAIAVGKKKTLPNLRNVLDRKMEDYIAGIMGVPDVYEEPGYTYTPMMYSPMPVFADGKLPKFEGGKPEDDIIQYTKNGALYNVNKNVVGAKELSVTTPDVNVVGTDQRPMYQRYDAEHSTYDPNAIKNITELAPGIGDVLQGFDAYNAAKNGLYGQAALLGAGLAIPNVIEKTAKPIVSTIAKKTPTTWIEGAWNAIKKPFEWIGGLFRRKPILMKRHFPEGRNVITHDMLDDDLSNEILKYNSAKSVLYSNTPEYKTSHHDVSNFFMSPLYKERVGRESGYRTWQDVTNRQLDNLSRSTVVDDPKYILYNDLNSPTDWGVYEGALGMNQDGRITVLPGSAQDIYDHEFLHAANNTTYENPYGVVNRHNAKFQMHPLKPGTGFELEELVQRVRAGMMDMEKRGYDYNNEKDIDRYLNLPMNELPDNIKQLIETYGKKLTKHALYRMYGTAAVAGSAAAADANDEYSSYKDGKSPIRIKPANRGKLTRLKKRTGKSESELYNDGNPAHKKMVVFARNARKWKH